MADVILADPEAALETATAQLAERAQVSQPQVIRFCRAIGFDGVTSFKRALAGSLALSRHGLVRDGAAHPTLAHSISALARMDAHCDGAALRRAAAALREARLVDVWAMKTGSTTCLNFCAYRHFGVENTREKTGPVIDVAYVM